MKIVLATVVLCVIAAGPAGAQDDAGAWTVATRAYMSGTSAGSTPEGYEVYSAFGLEAALRRDLGGPFSLELVLCPQSREVEFTAGAEPAPNLGSLEILPIMLLARWRAPGDGLRPYLGAGLALSVFWEKSGDLNSTDIPAAAGPALLAGAEFPLSPRLSGSVELKLHGLTADVTGLEAGPVELRLHPSLLSAGVGYRF